MRKAVRMFVKYGVDLIKLNLSGEEMTDTGAMETPMSDEECAMAVTEAKRRGKRVAAHARSDESVRSEEHTSELQSLMSISYAGFRLKKKVRDIVNRKYRITPQTTTRH